MSDVLLEKLTRWSRAVPPLCQPVKAAATALALKNAILQEDWGEQNYLREQFEDQINFLCSILYYYNVSARPAIYAKQLRLDSAFRAKHRISDHAIPGSLLKEYNQIASSDKRDFLMRAKRLSKHAPATFEDLQQRTLGVFRFDNYGDQQSAQVIPQLMNDLVGCLNTVDHPYGTKRKIGLTMPKDGPRTAVEMAVCCLVYKETTMRIRQGFIDNGAMPPAFDRVFAELDHIYMLLDQTLGDIAEDKRDGLIIQMTRSVLPSFVKTHFMDGDVFSGLLHFYLEMNQSKMPVHDFAKLRAAHIYLLQATLLDLHQDYHQGAGDLTHSESMSVAMETFTTFHEEHTPYSVDEIDANIILSIQAHHSNKPKKEQKAFDEFRSVRSSKPVNMDEVVILHYQEDTAIRKMRRRSFREPKAAFLKALVKTNFEDLVQLGLSNAQISEMAVSGSIPADSGLTVEHIIDREHGGTNHVENFILMPDDINFQKDKLKRAQTNYIPNSGQGCWIISWVPKKKADGTYPKVFIGDDVDMVSPAVFADFEIN